MELVHESNIKGIIFEMDGKTHTYEIGTDDVTHIYHICFNESMGSYGWSFVIVYYNDTRKLIDKSEWNREAMDSSTIDYYYAFESLDDAKKHFIRNDVSPVIERCDVCKKYSVKKDSHPNGNLIGEYYSDAEERYCNQICELCSKKSDDEIRDALNIYECVSCQEIVPSDEITECERCENAVCENCVSCDYPLSGTVCTECNDDFESYMDAESFPW